MLELMTESQVEVTTHGKWILLGEHAVLRGVEALAFPLKGKYLRLRLKNREIESSRFSGDKGEEYRLLVSGVIDRAVELLGLPSQFRRLHFEIESDLPLGAGLGASAALVVAVVKALMRFAPIQMADEKAIEICRQIENLFHGESSGVDVAVIFNESGICFRRELERSGSTLAQVESVWKPNWYLSYSGQRGMTAECVSKVKEWISKNPELGARTDQKMAEAVRLATSALSELKPEARFEMLKTAIKGGAECFEIWGLVNESLRKHMGILTEHGAAAVKPTGSGGGGYVLSLWQTQPPEVLADVLIPLN